MDDYSALAQRISVSVSGVSGAIILSRDGLVLGAFPTEEESLAKSAWLSFTALGEPDKSFVEFPDQVWAYVKRGPYAAFVLARSGTRPGILVDQMEQTLLVAEESRTRRDTLRVPDASSAPLGKPRTSLHPAPVKPAPAGVTAGADPPLTAAEVPAATPEPQRAAEGAGDTSGEELTPEAAEGPAAPTTLGKEPRKLAGSSQGAGFDEDAEVDRVLLAKEFSGLLQVDSDDDEGNL